MTDFSGFALEHSIDSGWLQFERWLCEALTASEDGDVISVGREPFGSEHGRCQQPHVVFTSHSDGDVRAEASSNRQLDRQFALTDEQVEQLVDIGWQPPHSAADALAHSGSTQFHVDLESADPALLAELAVRALREVYGVLHPAFLVIEGAERLPYDADAVDPGTAPATIFPMTSDGMPASGTLARDWGLAEAGPIAMPETAAHLRHLIEQSLVPMLGRRPLVDEDGDFVIPWDGALVFIRAIDSAPAIAVFSQLAGDVAHPDVAIHEVAELNASVEMVKFFLVGDRIVAGCTLPASPFVGMHLREMLMLVGGVARDFQQPLSLMAGEGPAFPA